MLRALVALLLVSSPVAALAAEPAPLVLEKTIPLPDVAGRIDHLAVDLGRKHLLVAELGNGTIDVVDLERAAAIGRISGLDEPQGIACVPGSDRIGGLAVIDPSAPAKLADIPLAAHPEGFQLEPGTGRVFVNLPGAKQIAVVDLGSSRQSGTWVVPDLEANFPLALDGSSRVAVGFRKPPRLVLFDAKSGGVAASLPSCGDADDVCFDAKRRRLYVSCGEGVVEVFRNDSTGTRPLAKISTPAGGRTSLFVPELDRLFVAVRAGAQSEASILVFRPVP